MTSRFRYLGRTLWPVKGSPGRVTPPFRCWQTRTKTSTSLPPRQLPTSGFVEVDSARSIEEEELPIYVAERYYPVRLGEVFASRYQVVAKLGYGTSSTAWLCRDLHSHGFRTLKVCTHNRRPDREIAISEHLRNSANHVGKKTVRLVLDSFDVSGSFGIHACLIYQPLGMSFTQFQNLLPENTLPQELVQRSIQLILISLAFLHENNVIHTDISTNNILQGIDDDSILFQMEEDEIARPIARKTLTDRSIYFSRPMPNSTGLPVLSDLGEAVVGSNMHTGDIMPGIYRAPEIILGMEWDQKVDIWSIGAMAWDMAEGGHLFFAKKDRILNDEQHLAEMVSLLGPPPPELLSRNEKALQYWDREGNWKGSIPVPEQSLDIRELQFTGRDKELFLNFVRRTLRWLPEERPTAEELAYDDFLMDPILRARGLV